MGTLLLSYTLCMLIFSYKKWTLHKWPSGLRRHVQVVILIGAGSNPVLCNGNLFASLAINFVFNPKLMLMLLSVLHYFCKQDGTRLFCPVIAHNPLQLYSLCFLCYCNLGTIPNLLLDLQTWYFSLVS